MARKRVDGIGKLTPAEKAERDARATYWMNQRKIERVWEACVRAWVTSHIKARVPSDDDLHG